MLRKGEYRRPKGPQQAHRLPCRFLFHASHAALASQLTMSVPIINDAHYLTSPHVRNEVPNRTLGILVNDVARLLRKRFEQQARATALGLTRAQSSVLVYLARQEGLNQAALAQILEIEPITLARLLDRLQAVGLVERRPDPKDRRAHLLYLTDAAYTLLDRIFELASAVREDAMAGIVEADRVRLIEILTAMKSNLIARDTEIEEVFAGG